MPLKTDLVIVWIKAGTPTEEEAEIINNMPGVPRVMNARFFSTNESERIRNCSVVNLTDNKKIDEFYAGQMEGGAEKPKQKRTRKPKQENTRPVGDPVVPEGDNVMPAEAGVAEPKPRPKPQANKD